MTIQTQARNGLNWIFPTLLILAVICFSNGREIQNKKNVLFCDAAKALYWIEVLILFRSYHVGVKRVSEKVRRCVRECLCACVSVHVHGRVCKHLLAQVPVGVRV